MQGNIPPLQRPKTGQTWYRLSSHEAALYSSNLHDCQGIPHKGSGRIEALHMHVTCYADGPGAILSGGRRGAAPASLWHWLDTAAKGPHHLPDSKVLPAKHPSMSCSQCAICSVGVQDTETIERLYRGYSQHWQIMAKSSDEPMAVHCCLQYVSTWIVIRVWLVALTGKTQPLSRDHSRGFVEHASSQHGANQCLPSSCAAWPADSKPRQHGKQLSCISALRVK